MAVTLRGVTTASTGSSTALITYTISNPSWTGSTTPAGDIVLLWAILRGTTAFTTPSGFTAVPAAVISSSQYQLFYRVTDGTEGATFTVSWASGGNTSSAMCRSYSGADTVLVMDPAVPSSSAVSGLAATGITTTRDGDLLVWFGATKTASAGQTPGTITPPSGFTGSTPSAPTSAAADPNVQAYGADAPQATHGATGTETGSDSTPAVDTTSGSVVVALAASAAVPASAPVWSPPAWFPAAPAAPGGEPFTPWPPWTGTLAPQDVLTAAATVTATVTASLVNAPAAWELPPQYAPAWFPAGPSAPGAAPFTPWPVGQTGVNSTALTAASTVTATGAAALTESKPVNAATTVTAAGSAAETTAKPVNAAQTVTAAASASLAVVKAGITPAPAYPPAWFPSAPSVPAGEPFTPWPAWSGFGGTSTPQDVLTAAATVTATVTASLTTAKPLNAAATVTATATAALTDVPGLFPAAPAPRYLPGWFPGSPAIAAMEPFAPWPVWTGGLPAPVAVLANAASAPTVTARDTSAAGAAGAATAATVRAPGPGTIYTPVYEGTYRPDPAPPGPKVTGPPAGATVTQRAASRPSVSDG